MKNKKGFTLMELLSVIVLLGIIITIGLFSISSIRKTILDRQQKNHKTEIELCKKRIKANKGLSAEEKEKYIKILDKDNFKDSIKW